MSRDYEAWNDMQRDAAPTVVTLKDCRRKARKDHVCDGCGRAGIKAGDTYTYQFFLTDGEPGALRFCADYFAHYGEGCKADPTPPRSLTHTQGA